MYRGDFYFISFCQTKKSSVTQLSNYKNDIINHITIPSHTKQKDLFYTLYWDETYAFPRLKHIDNNTSQIKKYKKCKITISIRAQPIFFFKFNN